MRMVAISSAALTAALMLTIVGPAAAQPRGGTNRGDLLDNLVRRMQICAEMADADARLNCYDQVSRSLGGGPVPNAGMTTGATRPMGGGSMGGGSMGGGAMASGGGMAGSPDNGRDPDRAYNPHDPTDRRGLEAAESYPPPPPIELRRSGPRPVHAYPGQPVVSMSTHDFGYNDQRYWQVTVEVTNNTARVIYPDVLCTFTNGGRPVRDVHFTPAALEAGEQVTGEVIGPPTTTFTDGVTCKVLTPLT